MRNFLKLSRLALTVVLAAGCTSRHWLATRSDNNMSSEPSGNFTPLSDKSESAERFDMGCHEKGSPKGKLSLDSRLKKDQKFILTKYNSFLDKKTFEKTLLTVSNVTDDKIEISINGENIMSVTAKSTEDGQVSEIKTNVADKSQSRSKYEVDDITSNTNCYVESIEVNSEKDMLDHAHANNGIYEFHSDYATRGARIKAARLSFESNGMIHCKKDGEIVEMGMGKLTLVEYHSNDVPSPTGIPRCGGTKIFESKKFTLSSGQVLEQYRQEITEAPLLN